MGWKGRNDQGFGGGGGDEGTGEVAEKAEAAAVSEGESAEMGLEFSVEKEEEKRAKEKTVEGDGVSEERPPGSACGAESGGHAVDITEVGGDDFGWRGVGVGEDPGPWGGEEGDEVADESGAELDGGLPTESEVSGGDMGEESGEDSEVKAEGEDLGDDQGRPRDDRLVDAAFLGELSEGDAEAMAIGSGEFIDEAVGERAEGGAEGMKIFKEASGGADEAEESEDEKEEELEAEGGEEKPSDIDGLGALVVEEGGGEATAEEETEEGAEAGDGFPRGDTTQA